MANTQKLAHQLAELDEPEWFCVLQAAQLERRNKYEQEPYEDPEPDWTREKLAEWIARRHLASDPGIREIIYLPAKAPRGEIRLLEVNVLLETPEGEQVEPLDFSPGIADLNFRVLAADITPEQWRAIRENKLSLPAGWDPKNCQVFKRGKKV